MSATRAGEQRSDRAHLRLRAVAVVLLTAALVLVPDLASARFTSQQAPTLAVGTARMVAPAAITGTYSCSRANGSVTTETVTFSVTGFTDAGPAGASYTYTVLRDGAVRSTPVTTTSRSQVVTGSQAVDSVSTVWTLSVQPRLGRWTGPSALVNVTCTRNGSTSGTL